jgi:hypothetical protein
MAVELLQSYAIVCLSVFCIAFLFKFVVWTALKSLADERHLVVLQIVRAIQVGFDSFRC